MALWSMGYLVGAAINVGLTPMATIFSMTMPITELITNLGIAQGSVLYSFIYEIDQYMLPYEFIGLLYFYATGWMKLKDLMKVVELHFLATIPFLLVICHPSI